MKIHKVIYGSVPIQVSVGTVNIRNCFIIIISQEITVLYYIIRIFLFWGNNKNITYFLPEEVMNDQPEQNKVVITQLDVDNKTVLIGQKINDQVILQEGIPYTNELTLNASNNNFSLMFSNLTYSEELQKYSYRLTPGQSEWLIAGDGERISYANLPAGEYLFEVRSIFSDGSNGDTTSLAITILPYWYEISLVSFTCIGFCSMYCILSDASYQEGAGPDHPGRTPET